MDNARNHELLQTKLRELGHAGVLVKFVKAEAGQGPAQRPRNGPSAVLQTAPAITPPPKVAPPVEAAPTKGQPGAVPTGQDDFKNDPLIKKALEIFKGQIVNARG